MENTKQTFWQTQYYIVVVYKREDKKVSNSGKIGNI